MIERSKQKDWKAWFKVPMFYQVGVVYMCSRISSNISQVFMPFFIQYSLNMGGSSEVIAIVPIVLMITSFVTAFSLKYLNRRMGRQLAYILGAVVFLVGLVGIWFLHAKSSIIFLYLFTVLIGFGSTTTLVTSISMQADLVGGNTRSGAFVYGSISFMEKFATGGVIIFTSNYSDSTIFYVPFKI